MPASARVVVPDYNADPGAVAFLRWARTSIEVMTEKLGIIEQGRNNGDLGQAATIASLAERVRDIEELDARSVLPVSFDVAEAAFGLSGTLSTLAIASIPAPARYTRAAVVAGHIMGLRNTDASGWANARLQSSIQGVGRGLTTTSITAMNYGNSTISASALLMDLSEGDIVVVATQASFAGAADLTSARTSGLVLFMR